MFAVIYILFLEKELFCEFKTDRIVIKLKSPSTFSAMNSKIKSSSVNNISKLNVQIQSQDDLFVVKLDGFKNKDELEDIISRLSKELDVEYIEPDYILKPYFSPNDPYYSYQWHFNDAMNGINLSNAWDIFRGTDSVVVAVLDTGILSHSDLDSSRILPGYDMISSTFVANDGDLRDSDPTDPGDWCSAYERNNSWPGNLCYDWNCAPNCTQINSSWHGLHVTGTISETTNNNSYGAGIDWYSRILPVRVLGKGGGYMSDVADGIRWASGGNVSGLPPNPNRAHVINLSLGGMGECTSTLQSAIDFAISQGVVVVVAAGNSDSDVANFSPANCNGVIAVAAIDGVGNRASYSNYGSLVFISAPGGGSNTYVWSLWNTGTTTPLADSFAGMMGTSMAAPHVTGVVSLMKGFKPLLRVEDIRYNIRKTAKPFQYNSTCNTSICGAGIIDANSSLDNLILSITSTTPNMAENDGEIDISIWGKGFLQEASVRLKKANTSDIICSNVNVVNLNQLDCRINLLNAPTGQWSIEVSNVDGSFYTLSNYFRIYSFYLSTITPTSGYNSDSNLSLTLSGSGFKQPMRVKLRKGNYPDIDCSNVNVINESTATCNLNLLGAFSGRRNIEVINGDEKIQVISDAFNIINTTPTLSYITPNTGYNDSQVIINVYGEGFYKDSTAKLYKNEVVDRNCNLSVYSSTYAVCNIDLYGVFSGSSDFIFSNSGNLLSLTDAFDIKNTTLTISGITPTSCDNSSSIQIFVYGKGFTKSTSLKLSKAGYDDIFPFSFTVHTSTHIVASFNFSNKSAGKRNLVVFYDNVIYVSSDAFEIIDVHPSPQIYNIEPTSAFNDKNPVIKIYGTNFKNESSFYILNNSEIKQITSFNIVSSTMITNVTLPLQGYPQGKWSIKVKNPDGKEFILRDCFTLLDSKYEFRVYEGIINSNSPNSKAKIVYNLDHQDNVVISVYDNMGKKIKEIYRGLSLSGLNELEWDGKDEKGELVKSGVYLIEIKTSNYKKYKRVVVIR